MQIWMTKSEGVDICTFYLTYLVCQVTMVVQDTRMVYIPIMPGHKVQYKETLRSSVAEPVKF